MSEDKKTNPAESNNKDQENKTPKASAPNGFGETLIVQLLLSSLKNVDLNKLKESFKESGAQTLTAIVNEVTTSDKFKVPSKIKKEDVQDLLKRHGVDTVMQMAKKVMEDKFTSPTKDSKATSSPPAAAPSVSVSQTNSPLDVSCLSIDDNTNFSAFVTYVLNSPKYKDKIGDAQIVSFIAANNVDTDIVVGNATKWLHVIEHARLMSSSAALDKKSVLKLNAQLVDSLFGKEMANLYKEHFGLAVAPVTSKVSRKVK